MDRAALQVCGPLDLQGERMSIDWSTAPNWAKELALNPYDEQAWLGDDGYSYLMGNGGIVSWTYETAYDRSAFKIMQIRPRPSVWTGEGLPPVGTFCEVVSPGYRNDRFERFIGQAVTVIAHDVIDDDPVAVFRMPVDGQVDEQDYHALVAKCFRPIRTPEQIAADERAANIEAMRADIGWKAPYLGPCPVALLYDAGYRKQSQR